MSHIRKYQDKLRNFESLEQRLLMIFGVAGFPEVVNPAEFSGDKEMGHRGEKRLFRTGFPCQIHRRANSRTSAASGAGAGRRAMTGFSIGAPTALASTIRGASNYFQIGGMRTGNPASVVI